MASSLISGHKRTPRTAVAPQSAGLPALWNSSVQSKTPTEKHHILGRCFTKNTLVGLNGLEPSTSTMSTWHSNQLSYNPEQALLYPKTYEIASANSRALQKGAAHPHSRSAEMPFEEIRYQPHRGWRGLGSKIRKPMLLIGEIMHLNRNASRLEHRRIVCALIMQ